MIPVKNVYVVDDLLASWRLADEQLASRAGTTQPVIARLESGKHPVSVRMLYRIAEAVGTTWRPVFGHQDGAGRDDAAAVDPVFS